MPLGEVYARYRRLAPWRPHTTLCADQLWRRWCRYVSAETPADDLDTERIDAVITAMREDGRSEDQIRRVLQLVVPMYRAAVHRRWTLQADPLSYPLSLSLGRGLQRARIDAYTQEEYHLLLQTARADQPHTWRLRVMLLFGGVHGARAGSIRHLRWDDVDLDSARITFRAEAMKCGRDLVHPLTPAAQEALAVARDWHGRLGYRSDWVLRSARADMPATHQGLQQALARLENRAGVRHRPRRAFHSLRRLCATELYARTQDLACVADWLGHADPRQTMKYLRQQEERLARAAETMGTALATEAHRGR